MATSMTTTTRRLSAQDLTRLIELVFERFLLRLTLCPTSQQYSALSLHVAALVVDVKNPQGVDQVDVGLLRCLSPAAKLLKALELI